MCEKDDTTNFSAQDDSDKFDGGDETDGKNHYLQVLLDGEIDTELPPQAKIVRIFTSSTFTDTEHERNILMKEVYPKLKDYCKENGYEFQVVDMRWGVRDEATADHMTTDICLNEIEACQRVSTGPNFVTFLSQKYGYRPFPSKIPSEEFEQLVKATTEEKELLLLDKWFECDYNNVPPVYILQPIYSVIPNYNNRTVSDELQMKASNEWWEDFSALQIILRTASQKLFGVTDEKYTISVTENEIQKGILNAAEPNKHCIWFHRKIENLLEAPDCPHKKQFIDVADSSIDEEAQGLLKVLRDEKLSEVLSIENISTLPVNWYNNCEKITTCPKCGVNPAFSEHEIYLKELCLNFELRLKKMIDDGIEARKKLDIDDELIQEIVQHAHTCKRKVESFQGRDDILKSISSYLSAAFGENQPLVLHGKSGIGKTSVMAKAYGMAKKKFKKRIGIIRFLGTTAGSSSISRLLYSICCQIRKAQGFTTDDIPKEYSKLSQYFEDLLNPETSDSQFHYERESIFIFIDSVDQLTKDNGAYSMQWLPRKLPFNIKIVLSTVPAKKYGILSNLRKILPDKSFVEITSLPKTTANDVLDSWLREKSRTITPQQREVVMEKFDECPSPLFLKISFNEIIQWKSYDDPSKTTLQKSVKDAISNFFSILERKHGKKLVSHALGLVTVSKSGLSDAEMEDLISIDDEVLKDVFQYWEPSLCRLPPMLWLRLRADIGSFMMNRGDGDTLVNMWYHRQFIKVARERYLSREDKQKYHMLCTEYFLGIWGNGVKKPFSSPEDERDRLITNQPFLFGGCSKHPVYNFRKLNELPYHLLLAGNIDHLKKEFLFNFEFLMIKLRACGYQQLLDDTQKAAEAYPDDEEVGMIHQCLVLSSSVLRSDADQLPSQLIGRYNHIKTYHAIKFLNDARMSKTPCLYPTRNTSKPPKKHFKGVLIGHTKPITALTLMAGNTKVITTGDDSKLRIFDLKTRMEEQSFSLKKKRLKKIFASHDQTCAVLVSHFEINCLNLQNGSITELWEQMNQDCDMSKDRRFLVCIDNCMGILDVFLCEQGEANLVYRIELPKIYSEYSYLVTAGGTSFVHVGNDYADEDDETLLYKLCVREFEEGKLSTTLSLKVAAEYFMFSPDGARLVIIHKADESQHQRLITIYDTSSWSILSSLNGSGRINSKFEINAHQVYTGTEITWSSDKSLGFWNIDNGCKRNVLESKHFYYGPLTVADESLMLVTQGNSVALYDLRLVKKFEEANQDGSCHSVHVKRSKDELKQSCFNPTASVAVSSTSTDTITLWSLKSGTETTSMELNGVELGKIVFVDEGHVLILNDSIISIYDYVNHETIAKIHVELGYTLVQETRELITMDVSEESVSLLRYNYKTGIRSYEIKVDIPGVVSNEQKWFSTVDGSYMVIERSGQTNVVFDSIQKHTTDDHDCKDREDHNGNTIANNGSIQGVIQYKENAFLFASDMAEDIEVWDIRKKMKVTDMPNTKRTSILDSACNGKLALAKQTVSRNFKSFDIVSMETWNKVAEYHLAQENIRSLTGRFSDKGNFFVVTYMDAYLDNFVITFDMSLGEMQLQPLAKLSLRNLTPVDILINDDAEVCLSLKGINGIYLFKQCGQDQ